MTTVEGIDARARGMRHCETTALGVLLRHEGVDLSEPMLFGLGSGLSFVYWDSKAMDFPFLGGRVKPFELTRNLAATLGLELTVEETASARKGWRNVVARIDAGRPVGLQLDSYHLDYFTSKVHFGGHVVAMYGYDEHRALLVDTDQQGGAVSTGLDGLARARAARGPMSARHRSFTLTLPSHPAPGSHESAAPHEPTAPHESTPSPEPAAPPGSTAPYGRLDPRSRIVPAITACAEAFLNPPIANLGHRGIEKAGRLVPTWLRRTDDPGRDLPQAALLMERAGTGGALFRNLYRDFLAESAELLGSRELRTGHALYAEAAAHWTRVAALVTSAGESGDERYLAEAGALLGELARLESAAMETLIRLGR